MILLFGAYYAYNIRSTQGGGAADFSTWKKFIPSSNLFEINLPNPPQYGKDYVQIPGTDKKRRYDMYASEKLDGTLFLITVITYPPNYDTHDSFKILQENIDDLMHQKVDNRLNNLLQSQFQNHDTLDFSFENKDFIVDGRSIHDDPIVYMLSYITKKNNFDHEEFQHFIDSFKILKPGSEAVKKE